ncbi:alpha-amylase family glycosyl hydrolase [Streptomyces sp. NRRL B-24484]|uniref:pullulanase X25 domain-containing protein n=1 Tax=Streptomyces sp. NRRL B-24484 TaxID=1463833 RepID=UPI0006938057|nr:alpha-amylase family glycosyl hydrolase [Streptomyces sp. NRRL B-24484]
MAHTFPRARPARTASFAALILLATALVSLTASRADAAPAAVSLPGTFDSEIGCSGDWQPDCPRAQLAPRSDGRWAAAFALPGGSYEYKVAIDNGWTENYGAGGAAGGANLSVTVPAGGASVAFVYDPATHLVDSSVRPVVTGVGDYQSELGCGADWAPTCTTTTLQDPDGDGVSTYTTTAIPAGAWNTKVTVGQSWTENYGAGGAAGGANIGFTVPADGATTTFSYDSATHLTTVRSTAPAATPTMLGAVYSPTGTTFRLWSPDSSDVSVSVGGAAHPMTPVALSGYSAVYQAVVGGDLKDQAYQFSVGGTAVRDPYAQMVRPGTTQGVVVDTAAVAPTGGSRAPRPALAAREDSVVYELSVRDFTVDPSSGVDPAKRGKFLGLVQTGTTTAGGARTGIDHLKELGVTTVQLMPSFDFGSTLPNWGYDPVDYNVPEEQYSQFSSPEDRIREFKDMVDGFHRNGIRVVMDVVYNHTYDKNVFGGITGKYYTPNDLSATGNSIDDGNPMVSRMIRDSLEHWVRDYDVDGFRFDLAGVHRYSSVSAWADYLNTAYPDRNLLLYGEPWSAAADPQEAQKVRYGTVPALAPAHVGVFNGVYRDAIRGGTDDDVMAYMGGSGNPGAIAFGMRGSPTDAKSTAVLSDLWSPAFAYDPEQTMNYASIHDNLNLYDKITYSGASGGAAGTAGRIDRFAVGMVLTSQGIPVIAEGDEFLRSKAVGGDYTTAKNSYDAPDTVNAIRWGDKTANAAVFRYYRDAVALRRAAPALRLTGWDAVHSQMTAQVDGSVVVGRIASDAAAPTSYDTVVVDNPTGSTYTVALPPGTWTKVLDGDGAASATGDTACAGLAVTVFRRN